jgi:4-carboxymuconolactone decarboxylase
MTRTTVLAVLLLAGATSIAWSQNAQQGVASATLDPANFTGKATAAPMSDLRVTRIQFEAGARTNWHSHSGGQVIVIEQGEMVVQERGTKGDTPGRRFKAQESYSVGANVTHWHGALPDAPLRQIALSYGTTNWMQKVADDQYKAALKK